MALKPVKPEDVTRLEDSVAAVAENLRKIRLKMQENKLESVQLQVEKAEFYLEWLKDWAVRAEASTRNQAARAAAREASRYRAKFGSKKT